MKQQCKTCGQKTSYSLARRHVCKGRLCNMCCKPIVDDPVAWGNSFACETCVRRELTARLETLRLELKIDASTISDDVECDISERKISAAFMLGRERDTSVINRLRDMRRKACECEMP